MPGPHARMIQEQGNDGAPPAPGAAEQAPDISLEQVPEQEPAVTAGHERDMPAGHGPEREHESERDAARSVTSATSAYEPAAPSPLGVQRVPTGNAEVDARLERLGDADHLPADGHLAVYEDVHRGLRDALTALDARPAPAPQAPPPSPPYNYRS